MKVGRPLELDDLKAKRIVDAIAAGNSRKCAAALAGIDQSALQEWLRRGRAGEPRFVQFAQRIAEADGKAEALMVRSIVDAAIGGEKPADWKAALAWLRHRRGATWHEPDVKPKDADKALETMPDEALLEIAGLVKKAGGTK